MAGARAYECVYCHDLDRSHAINDVTKITHSLHDTYHHDGNSTSLARRGEHHPRKKPTTITRNNNHNSTPQPHRGVMLATMSPPPPTYANAEFAIPPFRPREDNPPTTTPSPSRRSSTRPPPPSACKVPSRIDYKPESRLGQYRIIKTVGEGSFGKVKLAIHEVTGQKVALKMISRKNLTSRDMVEREIAYLQLLRHPQVTCGFQLVGVWVSAVRG